MKLESISEPQFLHIYNILINIPLEVFMRTNETKHIKHTWLTKFKVEHTVSVLVTNTKCAHSFYYDHDYYSSTKKMMAS